ncbi:MAG: DUF1015 family protein [Oscillospiraceae bacterium]|jgi:uncharacterized protein (DUF1015 family)|nr:DUF1015 family protein [Oscillospiraceae bacterium]
MATFRPFRAIRPRPELSAQVAALPYDTMSSDEARARAGGNPLSFLHIDKAEIDLPEGTGLYDNAVYETAAANLKRGIANGVYFQDARARFYIYRQTWQGRAQTGLVGCASIDDYKNNVIKKHELTHPEKETDRIRHVTACNANTGPIFLMYRDEQGVAGLLDAYCEAHACESRFEGPGQATQEIWPVADADLARRLEAAFAATPALYIADGHHRCASAANVGFARRAACETCTGNEEFNFFLAVAFPAHQLKILDYNRVVKDLNALSPEAFLSRVDDQFYIEPYGPAGQPYRPEGSHYFGMLLDGQWYKLRARRGSFNAADPVSSLDVEILQGNLLAPILGVKDPRRDHRIEFIGGIRGPEELERRCAANAQKQAPDMRVAFAMYPTTVEELMAIADSGNIMPPKSTWFEPKLLSGLFIHDLE